jgi:cytochrome c5
MKTVPSPPPVSFSLSCLLTALSLLLPLAAQTAQAAAPVVELQSGEHVYNTVCSACHASGVAHAPKFGDQEDWAPRLAEGQAPLTAEAWVGVRAMPAQGGNPELKLEEFSRAVAWMARQAGGDWPDPDADTLRAITREAEKRLYQIISDTKRMIKSLHLINQTLRKSAHDH